jgi:hypothetical protein
MRIFIVIAQRKPRRLISRGKAAPAFLLQNNINAGMPIA